MKQNSARNNAKCSKCFQFVYKNSDRTCFFNALTFPGPLGGVENRGQRPRFSTPPTDLANVNAGKNMFDPYIHDVESRLFQRCVPAEPTVDAVPAS